MDAAGDLAAHRDCFVSVRLGETQKLSRLAPSRVYRFPDGGDHSHGKIEVFRRLGTCNVDVDPEVAGAREVVMDCSDAGFGRVSLSVEREVPGASEGDTQACPVGDAECPTQRTGKMMAAKEYIKQHGLEARLAESMQALLRERPEHALEFLAKRFLRYSPTYNGDDEAFMGELLPEMGDHSAA